MTAQLKAILSELHARLSELYGKRLERLVLYGSQARGDAEPDSDIDVLVVLKDLGRRWDESRRVSEIRADISCGTMSLSPVCLYPPTNTETGKNLCS